MQMLFAVPAEIMSSDQYLGLPSDLFQMPIDEVHNCAPKEDVINVVRQICLRIDDHIRSANKLKASIPKENRVLLLQVDFSTFFP